MNEPRTDNHEAQAFQMPDAAEREAIDWSFTADEHQNALMMEEIRRHMVMPAFGFPVSNDLEQRYKPDEPTVELEKNDNTELLDEIFAYMSAPAPVVSVFEAKNEQPSPTKTKEEVPFADVVRDYFADSAVTEAFAQEKSYSATRAKEAAEARLIAINRKLVPSFFTSSDKTAPIAEAVKTPEAVNAEADAKAEAKAAAYAKAVEINRRLVPSFFKDFDASGTDQDIEEIDDSLVWANLGHIKKHDLEVVVEKADDRLLLQIDTQIALKGLVRELNEKPEVFKARTLALDPQQEVKAQTHEAETVVVEERDDFDDWKDVLAANEEAQNSNREFWAEAELLAAKRSKLGRKIGAAITAAAVAVMAVPAINNFLARYAGRSVKNDPNVQIRPGSTARMAADAAGAFSLPKLEFSTTTTTVVVENGVATVAAAEIKPSESVEVPVVSLADIAAEAKAKADAEDAEAVAAAEAANAIKAKRESLVQPLGSICGSEVITSEYGPRYNPVSGEWQSLHDGFDIGCEGGAPIRAYESGTVTLADWDGGYGNAVEIDNGKGRKTLYGHESKIADGIREGTVVESGQIIGYVGSTGNSTANHLHVKMEQNGVSIDPATVIGE